MSCGIGNVLEGLKLPYNSDSDWLSGVSYSVAKMEKYEVSSVVDENNIIFMICNAIWQFIQVHGNMMFLYQKSQNNMVCHA